MCVCVHLLEVEERKASLSEVSEAARVECVLKKKDGEKVKLQQTVRSDCKMKKREGDANEVIHGAPAETAGLF